jgi:rubredoxin
VTEPQASALLTCPDCGGILEPTRPLWATTIEVFVAADPPESESTRWKCLICGYHADATEVGHAPSRKR